MEDFLGTYGIWILLGGIFVAMQWFGGKGCGGGHRHGGPSDEEADKSGEGKKRSAQAGHSGGCH